MTDRKHVTRVTRAADGTRLLNQVDAATKQDVDKPVRDPKDGSRPGWQTAYPFSSGFEVK